MRILVVFFWIITGFITGVVASDKGHGFGSWTLVGFFLGPFGLLAAAGLSDQKLREYIRRTIDFRVNSSTLTKNNLLEPLDLNIDSSPKLLEQSLGNYKDQNYIYAKENYIGDFLIDKDASYNQIWNKIIEIFEFRNVDLVDLADQSKSNMMSSQSGGKACIIFDLFGEKLALAYSKECSEKNQLYWRVKLY
tara:strand:- start:1331 stop:1906 length:576 start_codon:yes stop_codon:yes gene_type:complete